jgi:hypothetical protein
MQKFGNKFSLISKNYRFCLKEAAEHVPQFIVVKNRTEINALMKVNNFALHSSSTRILPGSFCN